MEIKPPQPHQKRGIAKNKKIIINSETQ